MEDDKSIFDILEEAAKESGFNGVEEKDGMIQVIKDSEE